MVEINNISYAYKKKRNVLSNLDLTLESGKIYGLLGKNGTGKSTLLYLLAGLLTPRTGEILFEGNNVRKRLPETLREIFLVPEEFDLPAISLKQYVKINSVFYPNFSQTQMEQYLTCFDLDTELDLGALSMGQKKKVFMSFALATNTALLIMDEPTNGLDISSKSQFRKFMALGMTDEKTFIISTHQVQDVEHMLEHIVVIDENRVLLNESSATITSKLRFEEVSGEIDLSEILYLLPTVRGNSVIMENKTQKETLLNLELLYNALVNDVRGVVELFTNPKEKTK